MSTAVLDPTHETTAPGVPRAPRPADLAGKVVGIVSNGKEGTQGFFNHLDRLLREELGVAEVVQRVKRNSSAPADRDIMAEAHGWDAVIAGVGD
jgi:hypothetical protein